MRLHPAEPPPRGAHVRRIVDAVGELRESRPRPRRGPFLLAIDGRSSNGKSTLAGRIAVLTPASAVVHTDDLAWWHSRLGWDDLLLTEVIAPLGRGDPVDYRPTPWVERRRAGSIRLPAGLDLVVIEGVGAGRSTLAGSMGAIIWVQADLDVSEHRNRRRVEAGELDAAGYAAWMAEESPFQDTERTWERADLVVSGSAVLDDPDRELLVLQL
jgi:hypothetical protein